MEVRINKMINYRKMLRSFIEFSQPNVPRIYEHQLTYYWISWQKG